MRALALVVLLALSAGCIKMPDDPDRDVEDASFETTPPEERIQGMSVEDESKQDSTERCDNGITVPPGAWCAQRVLTVTGRIGLDALPVSLVGENGAIVLTPGGEDDAWSFGAVIKTRGLTEEEAQQRLDDAWSWSHEDASGHHLKAGPTTAGLGLLGAGLVGVQYQVVLPEWVVLELSSRTTNGAVALAFGQARSVDVTTTNGAVSLQGRVQDVRVDTSNGAIAALVSPAADGAFDLRTSNGAITLQVPEDARRGYDVDAQTTNGRVEILLRDGAVQEEGRNHKTFRTEGYEGREVRTEAKLATTNGSVTVTG